jgi:23S rRNA pseudouridine2605 synthase
VSAAAATGERIAKVLARAGLCSRRDAERWIAEGRVTVDGAVLTSPAVTVTERSDVRVDGAPLPQPERARLWRYHKPTGLVTTHRDEKGRPTVFDALPKELPRLISVGRLDLNAEGLLLLTNDGGLARRLELPATGWLRRYRVRVHGAVDPERLKRLAHGIALDGVSYGPIRAELERVQGSNAWLTVALREGKNREVKRVLEHLGLPVTRLIRISYGPFQLGNLAKDAVEEVPKKVLAEQLGPTPGAGPHPSLARKRARVSAMSPLPQAGQGQGGGAAARSSAATGEGRDKGGA